MEDKAKSQLKVIVSGVLVLLLSILLIECLLVGWDWTMSTGAPYRNEFKTHITAAQQFNDPEDIQNSLWNAIAGIERLGLKNDTYMSLYPWRNTYDDTVKFSIDYLASLIRYTDTVKNWKDVNYIANTTLSVPSSDVYAKMVDNLQSKMRNIDPKYIAVAYNIQNGRIFYILYNNFIIMVAILALDLFMCIIFYEERKRYRRYYKDSSTKGLSRYWEN